MTPRRSRARLVRAALPGDARVWWSAGVVSVLALVALLASLLVPRDFYTGTNSVRTRVYVAEVGPGRTPLCTAPQRIPAGTGRIEFDILAPKPGPPLRLEYDGPGSSGSSLVADWGGGRGKVAFPIGRLAGSADFAESRLCLHSDEQDVAVGGANGLVAGDRPATHGGKPLDARVAVWFRPPPGEKRSLASLAPDILLRAGLFRPRFVGRWTYGAILLVLMPLMIYAGVRLMAVVAAGLRPRVAVPIAVGLLAFAGGAAWSLVTPSFNAPDESEHFAYAQHLAETGEAPAGRGPPYSAEERTALDALRLFSSNERGDGKPPWLPVAEASWRVNRAHVPPGGATPPRDDGGGLAVATSAHSPLFYSLLAAPYAVASSGTIWERLWLMRLVSALLGAVVAACAALIVAELLPRRPLLAAAAGLLVAFQPMFSFMSGAVNNDMGVNAAAAVLLYLLVRGLMRGLTVRLALAIGAALAVAPLMKATGLALYPAAGVALAVMLWRLRHGLAWLRPAVAFGATAVALLVIWSVASGAFDRDALTTPEGGAPLAGSWSVEHPLPFLSYLWEVFLPRLPFMAENWPGVAWPAHDIWVVRGFGSFGWYAMTFADWVYVVIAAVMVAVGALALAAVVRRPEGARHRAAPIAVLALAVAGVIGGVHAYYFGPVVRTGVIPEQGRYAFPAIAALAAVTVGSLLALPRRMLVPAAAGLVTAMMWLAGAGLFTALARFYS